MSQPQQTSTADQKIHKIGEIKEMHLEMQADQKQKGSHNTCSFSDEIIIWYLI